MTEKKLRCPECESYQVVKNGTPKVWITHKQHKVQQWRCNACGRQFRYPRIGRKK